MKTNKQIYEKFGNLMDLYNNISELSRQSGRFFRVIRCLISLERFIGNEMSIFANRRVEFRMIFGKYLKYKKVHEKKET